MNTLPLSITENVAAGFIRGYNLIPPLYRYNMIEDAAAEMLAKSEVPLDLDGVSRISNNAIHHLVKRQDNLCLGISSITDEQAIILADLGKSLSLNNLKSISLSALKILVSTPRELLAFDGLTTLTPDEANLLSHFRGGLSLKGLARLDEEVAKHLGRHVGSLSLDNLKSLTTEEARHLAGHQGGIQLDSALKIPREGAYILCRHLNLSVNSYSHECYVEDCLADGTDHAIATARNILTSCPETLCLHGLNALQCSGAEVLAKFPGELQLPALDEIDPEVADLLAEHNGPSLALDGLSLMTSPVAESLGKHRGALSLRGIRSFQEDSPRLLALHDGILTLPLPEGGNDKFEWFKNMGGKITWTPSGIDHHDLAVLEEILQSDPVEIEIPDEVHFVSNTVFARLGYACRALGTKVAISGLRQIDQQQCHLLAGNHVKTIYAFRAGSLVLDGLLQMTADDAAELGTSGLNLSLSSLSNLSSETLQRLTQDVKDLTLTGLESVNEEGCRYLATVPGQLHLDGIKLLPVGCAAAISTHKGHLTLNGLHTVSAEEARDFTRHNGTVELKGIPAAKINSALLDGLIKRAIVLDEVEIFNFIRGFVAVADRRRPRATWSITDELETNDSAMPEMVVRLLIEQLSMCLDLVEGLSNRECRVFLMRDPGASPDREIFDVLAPYRRTRTRIDLDDLIRYVSEKYFDREIIIESEEHELSIPGYRKVFDHLDNRAKFFQKICAIAGCGSESNTYTIEYGSKVARNFPGLTPIIDACFRTVKRIMSLGVMGEMNTSFPTLLVLGCLLGEKIELPEVGHLFRRGAMALSILEAELVLNGIKELSHETALLLSEHEGYSYTLDWGFGYETVNNGALELNGIQHLSVDIATALARHRGGTLHLNGLSTIEDSVAIALSKYKGCQMGVPRCLELHGLQSLSPCAAHSLSGCLDQDPWQFVDGDQVESRYVEVMLDWHAGDGNQVDCVLDAFKNFSIFLSHQKRCSELEDAYIALRNSLEGKFGKASKTWVSCVVHAAYARASDELSSTELILQETIASSEK